MLVGAFHDWLSNLGDWRPTWRRKVGDVLKGKSAQYFVRLKDPSLDGFFYGLLTVQWDYVKNKMMGFFR